MIRVGVVGYGARIQSLTDLMQRLRSGVEIVAVTDIRDEQVKQRLQAGGWDLADIAFYTDADKMLDAERLDGVMVGTRCSMHAAMARKVLARNLPLYLEKPVATNMQDLLELRAAAAKSSSEVVVSFPLRLSPMTKLAKEIIDSGQVGTIEHAQAWNNVPYGGTYYQNWYRDENETQGLFVQKATHDFDYINYLLGTQPRWICAMSSKQIFKGDRPAGLRCDDCQETDSCLESPFHLYYTRGKRDRVEPSGLMCAFAADTGNEDSGSALIEYANGMHVCYTQNFFARNKAGKRGARLLGYKGTIEFDWYTAELNVYMHHIPRADTYKFDVSMAGHGGGDVILVDNFLRVVQGKQPSLAPLSAGMLSALMCLKAKESAATKTFQEIAYATDGRSATN
ncbi:MAG: oxidoreductase [Armatimonadetes bacterium RBG_16_58_9]|nr:MAG: oxidoreductase [Armatimonadetes bacterium RBG_16_58_9]